MTAEEMLSKWREHQQECAECRVKEGDHGRDFTPCEPGKQLFDALMQARQQERAVWRRGLRQTP